jgi:hypothetical protein
MSAKSPLSSSSSPSPLSSCSSSYLLSQSLAFVVPRRIALHDRRLGILHRTLQAGVVVYIAAFQLAALHQYAEFEPASPFVNVWPGAPPPVPQTAPAYCSNSAYDWGTSFTPAEQALTGGFSFSSVRCVPFDSGRHTVAGETSFTSITAERRAYANGTVEQVFTTAPEEATFNAIHAFSASWLAEGVVNPRTLVRSKSGELLATFEEGSILGGLPLSAWMRFAGGASLEARNIQPWIRGGVPTESPFFRTTGMVLLLRVAYSNLRMGELPSLQAAGRPQADVTIEVLPTAWGFIGSVTEYDAASSQLVSVSRMGIKIQIIFSGEVGVYSASELVRRIVEAIVLLGAAAFVTEAVARWGVYRGRDGAFQRIVVDHAEEEELLKGGKGLGGGAGPATVVPEEGRGSV